MGANVVILGPGKPIDDLQQLADAVRNNPVLPEKTLDELFAERTRLVGIQAERILQMCDIPFEIEQKKRHQPKGHESPYKLHR